MEALFKMILAVLGLGSHKSYFVTRPLPQVVSYAAMVTTS